MVHFRAQPLDDSKSCPGHVSWWPAIRGSQSAAAVTTALAGGSGQSRSTWRWLTWFAGICWIALIALALWINEHNCKNSRVCTRTSFHTCLPGQNEVWFVCKSSPVHMLESTAVSLQLPLPERSCNGWCHCHTLPIFERASPRPTIPPISKVIQAWHAEVTRFILFGPSQQVQQPIYKSKAFDDVALISNLYANVIVRGEVPKATTLRGSSQCLGDVFQKVKPWSLCLARVWSYQLLNNKWHYDDAMQCISMCTVMEWQLAKVGYGWSKGRQKLDEPQEVAERLGYSGS